MRGSRCLGSGLEGFGIDMQIELSSGEVKLLVDLLERAGDEFGSHGCNDYSLSKYGGLTDEESRIVFAGMQVVFPRETEEWEFNDCQQDWFLMAYLQERFKRLLP